MNQWIVVAVLLFVWLHIRYQWKVSKEVELYEIDHFSKNRLEELCELKQPVLFPYSSRVLAENKYVTSAVGRVSSQYLQEKGIIHLVRNAGHILRPPGGVVQSIYRLVGHSSSKGPLDSSFHYHVNVRTFYMVVGAPCRVMLSPPGYESGPVTDSVSDSTLFGGVTEDSPSRKITHEVPAGSTLFVPPYWWFHMEPSPGCAVIEFSYRTWMNELAILPYWVRHIYDYDQSTPSTLTLTQTPTPIQTPPPFKESVQSSPDGAIVHIE